MDERDRRYTQLADSQASNTALALSNLDKATANALAAADRAQTKAEIVSEKRQDVANDIRTTLGDQQKNFADKALTEQKFQSLETRVNDALQIINSAAGRSQGMGMSAALMGQIVTGLLMAAGVIVAMLALRRP